MAAGGRHSRILLVLALVASCAPARLAEPAPTAIPTPTPTPTASPPAAQSSPTQSHSPTPSPTFARPSGAPGSFQTAVVVRVVDGDTIRVSLEGREVVVRYIGMDTPETVDPGRPVEPFGQEATEVNRRLVEGRTVLLEKDISETDRFGRLLRYVYVEQFTGTLMVNAELVRLGYARVATFPPDVKYAQLFLDLEREARENGRGLWADPASPTPSASP